MLRQKNVDRHLHASALLLLLGSVLLPSEPRNKRRLSAERLLPSVRASSLSKSARCKKPSVSA